MTSDKRKSATVAHVDHDVDGNERKPSAQLKSTHSTITTENAIISSQRSSRASVSRYERPNDPITPVRPSTTASVASEKRKPTQMPGSSRNSPPAKIAALRSSSAANSHGRRRAPRA